MRARRLLWSRSLAGLLALGCSGGAVRAPDASDPSLARVRVTFDEGSGEPRATVAATFLRYHALGAAEAALVAGAPRALTPQAGRCVREDDEAALDRVLEAASPDAEVALLDAGELVVSTDAAEVRAAPRYVPELLPFVAGVVYATEEPTGLPLEGDVLVSATGGEVERFETAARIPTFPTIVVDGEVAPASVELYGAPRQLEVGWMGDGAGTLSIVVDGAGGRVRCWPAGAGAFPLPAPALDLLATGGTLALERAGRHRLDLAGVRSATLELVARASVVVRVW